MTKLLIVVCIMFWASIGPNNNSVNTLNSHAAAVPQISSEVNAAFKAQFGQATAVHWTIKKDNLSKATFNLHGQLYSALYKKNGGYIAHYVVVLPHKLPPKIIKAINELPDNKGCLQAVKLYSAQECAWYMQVQTRTGIVPYKGYINGNIMAL